MCEQKPFSVNFDDMEKFLDDLFAKDEKSKEIMKKANFTESQVKIINTLIISALKVYDLQKRK